MTSAPPPERRKRTVSGSRVGFTAALSRVWYWSLLVGLYSLVPIFLARTRWVPDFDFGLVIDTALGAAIGFVLVMRINRAYERWWEARTLWGLLVNVCRSLAIKAREIVRPEGAERAELVQLIAGFAFGLKAHLRHDAVLQEVPGFEGDEENPAHVPSHLAGRLYALLVGWEKEGRITAQELWILDMELREFMQVAGGCERIQNTLMAQSFPTLVRQALVVYLLYLPWSIAHQYGVLALPLTVLLAYFVIAAEGIAHYVERPFGFEDDHLDLESICQTIQVTVGEILAER